MSLEMFGNRGSRRRPNGGRQNRSAAVAERRGPAGVKEQGTFIVGFSRNLGGPVVSVEETGLGESGEQPLACGCCALRLRERSPRRCGGTAKRRKRSDAGMAAGSRSASQYRRSGGTNPRDPVEGREHRNAESFEGKMAETLSSTTVSTKLERIAKLAREVPHSALTTLAHHIDIDWLREAYRRTRKNGATGVDRQTAASGYVTECCCGSSASG